MAVVSKFSNSGKLQVPPSQNSKPLEFIDLRGLDLNTPYDVMKDNRTPYATNFRIYAEENDDKRVTVSNRKGSGFYTIPVGAASAYTETSTTGQSDAQFNIVTWKATPFTPTATGPLTQMKFYLKNNSSSRGAVIVDIYTDSSGVPGTLIASSSVSASSITATYTLLNCRLIDAPAVTSGTKYWAVLRQQDDGADVYYAGTNTGGSTALSSGNSGLTWVSQSYRIAVQAYVSSTNKIKGLTRFAPASGANVTLTAIGTDMYTVNDNTGATTSIVSSLNATASNYYFTYADGKVFWVNGFDGLKTWDGTTVATISHTNLPILSLATFHKNRLFGVSATDPNRLIYSEDPGNNDGTTNVWYDAYLSTSFIYVPSPKASDPITALESFQDNLVVYTRTSKYILYGSDPGSFTLRQATGKKGSVSQKATYADENFIYSIAPDGLYRFNGSSDEQISQLVQPEFNGIADFSKTSVTKWKNKIRFYYPSSGSPVANRCLIWDTLLSEWMLDTDTFVSQAIPWIDGNDPYNLVEASSVSPTLTFAEQQYSNLGKQIDFEYYCRYDSMGNPGIRKRITRFFPFFQTGISSFNIQIGLDKDRADNTEYQDIPLDVGGALVGTFKAGDGTVVGSLDIFKPQRMTLSGYAYYWQVRIKRKSVDNKIRFIGYTLAIRSKRL